VALGVMLALGVTEELCVTLLVSDRLAVLVEEDVVVAVGVCVARCDPT